MSGENDGEGDAGLVLGGGGARGAYASGALSVLLPVVKERVRVIVGTSAGALIAAYLAANWHRDMADAIDDGLSFWRGVRFGDVLSPLMAPSGAARFIRYVGEFLPVSSWHAPSVLHPEPLEQTLVRMVDFDQLGENIREQGVALGVVATPAHSNRSVVFHQGATPRHHADALRGIEYVATAKLCAEHVLASSAIPALFPAVRVTEPERAAGWYFDGGPRLNTPIKPALWMGAKRVIVIALNSVAPSRTAPPNDQPDFYVGAAHLLHAALGDPLAQDIRTLANTNALIAAGLAATDGQTGDRLRTRQAKHAERRGLPEPVQPVPYIFIAPEDPAAIGEIARRVYREHYGRPWKAGARDLWLLGKILNAGADAMHGELLSYLFFASEFAEKLIQLGQADARRWIDEHPMDLWQLDPLPAWNPVPSGDISVLKRPQLPRAQVPGAAKELVSVGRERSNGVG
ncbi:MAG: patatin-like phospholipase family protein [Solirubrobacteraceae bacterium]